MSHSLLTPLSVYQEHWAIDFVWMLPDACRASGHHSLTSLRTGHRVLARDDRRYDTISCKRANKMLQWSSFVLRSVRGWEEDVLYPVWRDWQTTVVCSIAKSHHRQHRVCQLLMELETAPETSSVTSMGKKEVNERQTKRARGKLSRVQLWMSRSSEQVGYHQSEGSLIKREREELIR